MVTSPLVKAAKKNKVEQSSWLERGEGKMGKAMERQSECCQWEMECRQTTTCRSWESVLLSGEVHSSNSHPHITQGSDVCLLQSEMFPSLGFPLPSLLTLKIIVWVCMCATEADSHLWLSESWPPDNFVWLKVKEVNILDNVLTHKHISHSYNKSFMENNNILVLVVFCLLKL